MFKRIISLMLAAFLMTTVFAFAQQTQSPGYDIVYTSANPIPDIAERVRPSVVQVVSQAESWDAVTRIASVDDVGYGSGCYIIDDKKGGGYVLTNYHVVAEGEVYKIEWLSGESMECELVGHDDGTDIAVLHFEEAAPAGAQPIPMGDSDSLRIGELAICIGNPGDGYGVLYGTVTAGIISGLEREDINANNFSRSISVIQVDAAINAGNSGGAMLNAKGELVGIPTLKLMTNMMNSYEGLGFCVPINTVKDLIDQIIDTGSVTRPRIGVTIANIDGPEEPMKKYPPIGAQVYEVEIGGPSDKAGIQVGDVITEVNDVRIYSYLEVIKQIDLYKAGDVITLKVYRYYDENGNLTGSYDELELEVKLAMLD